ncbi:hypothetical protein NC653_024694 [Populus alba x Populus x berolinensis]|uniref:Uncharacterized protein n=2 Tax=Populus alba x Populus x berolinensis TaxID=444605 RepID=A0AAD6M9T8_9ROSI|nr:hypothetical protein NC653_024694 [Populus alba x Populus x berolinensis]
MALEAPSRHGASGDQVSVICFVGPHGMSWAYKKGGLVRPISGVPVSWPEGLDDEPFRDGELLMGHECVKISAIGRSVTTCKNLIFKLVGQEFSDIDVIDKKPWVMHAEVAEKHASCDNQIILAGMQLLDLPQLVVLVSSAVL